MSLHALEESSFESMVEELTQGESKIHPVRRRTRAVKAMAQHWELPDALIGGTFTMRAQGRTWLPQELKESNSEYEARLDRSYLFNVYRRTVHGTAGRPFSKPIALHKDIPPRMLPWLKNIDRQGADLQVFCLDMLREAIHRGQVHVLVDNSRFGDSLSVKAEEDRGIRPGVTLIPSPKILGWRSRVDDDDREFLTQVRILSHVTVEKGRFEEIHKDRVKVFNLVGDHVEWETFEQSTSESHEMYTSQASGVIEMDRIPLVTLQLNSRGFMRATPELEDLAYIANALWRSESDQGNILHIARVPRLFGAGISVEQVKQWDGEHGVARLWFTAEKDGTLAWVETKGAAIEAGEKDIERKKSEASKEGLEMLLPRSGDQTATGQALDAAELSSRLQASVVRQDNSVGEILDLMAEFGGITGGGGTVSIFKLFGELVSGEEYELNTLARAREKVPPDISLETYWSELKRRQTLGADFEADAERAQLTKEAKLGLGKPLEAGGSD